MVSSVTSAPRALEASGIWRFSSTSDSGMKSTHLTQWSFVPWANAGARREARTPSMPPATTAAAPAVLMNVRRFTLPLAEVASSCCRDALIAVVLPDGLPTRAIDILRPISGVGQTAARGPEAAEGHRQDAGIW